MLGEPALPRRSREAQSERRLVLISGFNDVCLRVLVLVGAGNDGSKEINGRAHHIDIILRPSSFSERVRGGHVAADVLRQARETVGKLWSIAKRGVVPYCPRGSKTLSGGVNCLSVTHPWAVTQSRTAMMVMA